MKTLIDFFVRYPVMVNLGLLFIVAVGLLSFSQVRYTLDPSEDPTEIYIDITYRGASPLEIEEQAISRIEENLRGINGIDRVTSNAMENRGQITIETFEWADIDPVMTDAENAVNRISDFPDGMEKPVIYRQEMLNQTISLALTGDLLLQEKRDYARQIRDDFMIDLGISNVNLFGFPDEEIVVELDDAQMDRYEITFGEVAGAIQETNINLTGGELKLDEANWQIRARNQDNTALDIGAIPLRSNRAGARVQISDIANVRESFADRPAERYLNGNESVVLQVLTTNQENLLDVAEDGRAFARQFNAGHQNVKLTVVEDISVFVEDRVASLWENGLMGVILVLLILAMFLDKRIAFWVSLTIPLSLLGTFLFALMEYDLTINVVSIFGFILVLGMLVDTGVVVAENIYRQYSEFGKSPFAAARDGAAEVAVPMVISLLTTAVAFSLFFFLPGRPGAFFTEVSFVVITALVAALAVTFLFLPAKMTRSKVLTAENRQTRFEIFFTKLLIAFRDRWFMPFTQRASHKWKWINVAAFVFLLAGCAVIVRSGILPVNFFPYLDDDIQLIRLGMEPGTPADTTYSRLLELEETVNRVNERISAERKKNSSIVENVELAMGPNSHQGQVKVVLVSGEQRGIPAHEINDLFREEAGDMAGARYVRFMGATAEDRFGGMPVDISVSGDNLNQIQQAAARLKEELLQRNDLVDVADTDQRGNPELHIELTHAGEQLGLTLQDVMMQVRTAFFGMEVQNLQRNRDDVRVWLQFDEQNRDQFRELDGMKIRTPQGNYPLQEVADIYPTEAMMEISHIDGRRAIRVDAGLASPDLSAPSILAELEQELFPVIRDEFPSVTLSIEGQNREAGQVTGVMKTVAPVIILLMLALIVINFQSFGQTVLVLLSLPFALVGVVAGHLVHGLTLNIFSLIGMIALIGILINNLLVLITAYNDNLKTGMSLEESLTDAVRSRFRPILLTTLSTVAGLLPMIFMGGLASAFLQPPAISIAYGLTFGLFISLTLVPALLVIRNKINLGVKHRFGNKSATPESIEPAVVLHEHHKRSNQ